MQEYFIIIDFFPPTSYKKRTYQNPIIALQKMGVTEEGSYMSEESKKEGRIAR